jgi:peroxiredoxin
MTALFFVPVEQWPGKPLFWYLANVNESFEITGIPPGTYYLFTVETSNPRNIDDVGLPVDWPEPVQIRADGKPAHLEIEISAFLSKKARFWNLQGFLRGVGHLNAENVASEELGPYGKVTDTEGRPVPYATVQVREFKPSGTRWGGIRAPDARTNEEGYYGLRPVDYSYCAIGTTYESLKEVAGFRSQSLRRNKVCEGKQRLDFQLGPWLPDKTIGGTIEGSVVDANENPIPSFMVTVSPDKPWVHVDQTEEPWTKSWWLRAAFSGGKFKLTEVPPGGCDVTIMCHKSSARSGTGLGEKKVTVVDAKTVNLKFSVEDWEKKKAEQRSWYWGRRRGVPAGYEPEPEPMPELKVGDTAPLFEVKTLDNKTWKSADHRGKVVLLVFWVAGSQPSEIQLPDIDSAYQSFSGNKRFAMLGLVRKKRKVQDLKQYVLGHDLAWEQTLIDEEDKGNLPSQYGVRSWPSVILLGPDGKVIARNLKGKTIKWAVEKALNSRP